MLQHIEPGDRFGRLAAVGRVDDSPDGRQRWLFRCDCGTEKPCVLSFVIKGRVQSCGCLGRERLAAWRHVEIPSHIEPGDRFACLVAIGRVDNSREGRQRWLFRCDCGAQKISDTRTVIKGKTKSCGCFARDIFTKNRSQLRHGGSGTPEYKVWDSMRQRCNNPKNQSFPRYGARGITVCERWHIFENFLADMGPRPSAQHSIDRQNNDGNYEPGNCGWATNREQQNNTRSNIRVVFEGIEMTLSQACALAGKNLRKVRERMRRGRSFIEALSVVDS